MKSLALPQDVKDIPCVWRVKTPLAELYGLPTELPDRLVSPCTPSLSDIPTVYLSKT